MLARNGVIVGRDDRALVAESAALYDDLVDIDALAGTGAALVAVTPKSGGASRSTAQRWPSARADKRGRGVSPGVAASTLERFLGGCPLEQARWTRWLARTRGQGRRGDRMAPRRPAAQMSRRYRSIFSSRFATRPGTFYRMRTVDPGRHDRSVRAGRWR
jgi:hypothetical protein